MNNEKSKILSEIVKFKDIKVGEQFIDRDNGSIMAKVTEFVGSDDHDEKHFEPDGYVMMQKEVVETKTKETKSSKIVKSSVVKIQEVRVSKDDYYLGIALEVSKRSTCLKRHYGCVIVNNDEIIATGYNGSPRGMLNCCDVGRCLRLDKPHNSGDYSDCNSVHAEQNAMLSASRKDMIGATMYLAGEEECCTSSHSEECTGDCGIWCSGFKFVEIKDCSPCPICTRMILNAGIKTVTNRNGDLVLRKLV